MNALERIYPKRDFFENLGHILDFQINDLNRCSELAPFLVAVGCMNTIEFLGGIRNGELGVRGQERPRFEEGVCLLGDTNSIRRLDRLAQPVDADTMWTLRCGLTHQYLPRIKATATIFIGAGMTPGTKYGVAGEIERAERHLGIRGPYILVDVVALIKAIDEGRNKLVDELKLDESKRLRAEKALSRLPELL